MRRGCATALGDAGVRDVRWFCWAPAACRRHNRPLHSLPTPPQPRHLQPPHHHHMPLYELLCLVRPALPKPQLAEMIAGVGRLVCERGGVVKDVVSFGKQPLAYPIKGVQGKFEEAHIFQLDFALSPEALRELNTQLRISEDVLRHAVVKRSLPTLPSPRILFHAWSKHAKALRPPPRPGKAPLLQLNTTMPTSTPTAATATTDS